MTREQSTESATVADAIRLILAGIGVEPLSAHVLSVSVPHRNGLPPAEGVLVRAGRNPHHDGPFFALVTTDAVITVSLRTPLHSSRWEAHQRFPYANSDELRAILARLQAAPATDVAGIRERLVAAGFPPMSDHSLRMFVPHRVGFPAVDGVVVSLGHPQGSTTVGLVTDSEVIVLNLRTPTNVNTWQARGRHPYTTADELRGTLARLAPKS